MKKHIISQLREIVGPRISLPLRPSSVCVLTTARRGSICRKAVVWPSTVDQVSRIMVIAHQGRLPVVARGRGPA